MIMDGSGDLVVPWAAIVDSLDHAVLVLDGEAVVRVANTSATWLLGASVPEELIDTHVEAVLGRGIAELLDGSGVRSGPVRMPLHAAGRGLFATVTTVPGGSFVALKDVGRTHPLPTELSRFDEDRASLLSLLEQVRPGDDLVQTVRELCLALQRFEWIDGAMVFLSPKAGSLLNVTPDVPDVLHLEVGMALTMTQLQGLLDATEEGPWFIDLGRPDAGQFVDEELLTGMLSLGIKASAYAAIHGDGELLGVLSVASFRDDAASVLARRLGSLEDLASISGSILRTQAVTSARSERVRHDVRELLRSRAFHPVFQPVVILPGAQVVGFEALTRFADGRPPDTHFLEAAQAGLGVALEQACAQAALDAARDLPLSQLLGLNFSPEALVDGVLTRLDLDRPVVVEITEHAVTSDYEAVRTALAQAPDVTIAVDDAGAGYASLRHILELRPQFVKLDIGLIRDIDSDPVRAAMVAGMRHFANLAKTPLVAEGVETQAEADALAELGILLAQGYLFGRPEPMAAYLDRG